MKDSIKLLICSILIIASFSFAQTSILVSGKVIDESGEPLIGANVMIKALKLGAATDLNGEYRFTIPATQIVDGEVKLEASYMGYESEVVKIVLDSEKIVRDFELKIDVLKMDEINEPPLPKHLCLFFISYNFFQP